MGLEARSWRCRPEHRADKCVSSPIALPTGAAQFLRCHLPSGQAVAAEMWCVLCCMQSACGCRRDCARRSVRLADRTALCCRDVAHAILQAWTVQAAGAAEMRRTVQISECT